MLEERKRPLADPSGNCFGSVHISKLRSHRQCVGDDDDSLIRWSLSETMLRYGLVGPWPTKPCPKTMPPASSELSDGAHRAASTDTRAQVPDAWRPPFFDIQNLAFAVLMSVSVRPSSFSRRATGAVTWVAHKDIQGHVQLLFCRRIALCHQTTKKSRSTNNSRRSDETKGS